MDTFTLIAVHAVLTTGGLRSAARSLGRPVASISAAVTRLEKALATPLVSNVAGTIAPTLEAQRLRPELAKAAEISAQLHRMCPPDEGQHGGQTVSLLAFRRFTEVVRAGSIRRAARDLQMGQPQLSRQVSSLETLLRTRLLNRSDAGIQLTPSGLELVMQAEALEAVWQGLARHADSDFRRNLSTFRLGTIIPLGHESETARQLAALAARWLSERPKTPLFISSTTAEDLMNGLQTGLFDLALLDTDLVPVNLERKVVASLSLAIVGRPPLLYPEQQDLSALLQSRPIAVPSKRSGLRQRFMNCLTGLMTEAERDALTLVEIDSLPILVNLVLEHGFLAVLPQASFATMDEPLASIPLDPAYDLKLTLAWPPTYAARRLADLVLTSLWSERR
jgi:LysR family transcriptional regulator, nitrogen assimilation regulatory protein